MTALEIANSMPEALEAAESIPTLAGWSPEACRDFARRYATVTMARLCRDASLLLPRLFDGPNGPAQRAVARRAWRALHNVQDDPPLTADDMLAAALARLATPPPRLRTRPPRPAQTRRPCPRVVSRLPAPA